MCSQSLAKLQVSMRHFGFRRLPASRVAWLASFALSVVMQAQPDRASLNGTVTDSGGAPVPGAIVTALHASTGLARKTETCSEGAYVLDGLPLGRYTIVFTKRGFSELRVDRVEQTIGEARTLNAKLSPGADAGSFLT